MKKCFLCLAIVLFVSATAFADLDYKQAESLVKNLPCTEGGTVGQYLDKKAKIPAIEDLGWKAYPRDNGFEIERFMLLDQTMQLRYKWEVDKKTGKVTPINGKAIGITKQ